LDEASAEPAEIEIVYIKRAVRLVKEYFWPHARAALRLAGFSERHATARRVLRWIKANERKELSLQNIRRDALNQILDAIGTKALLDGLVQAGWAREVPIERRHSAGRYAHRWEINPILFGPAEIAEIAEIASETPLEGISAISAIPASHTELQPNTGDSLTLPDFLNRNLKRAQAQAMTDNSVS
jgi:hypothetical protein